MKRPVFVAPVATKDSLRADEFGIRQQNGIRTILAIEAVPAAR